MRAVIKAALFFILLLWAQVILHITCTILRCYTIWGHMPLTQWYFTNVGLDVAKSSLPFAANDNSLSFIPSPNGSHIFIPSTFANDKAIIVQDDSLSFEQFRQATLHMVTTMRDSSWIKDHVNMHIKFWSNIENHTSCNSKHAFQQCALLVYQSEQHRYWHTTIEGPNTFNLTPINKVVLTDTHNHLLLKTNNNQFRLIQVVSIPFPTPMSHQIFSLFPLPLLISTHLIHSPHIHWSHSTHASCQDWVNSRTISGTFGD